MSGVIKKLYHPNTPNGGTVTTDNSSQTLQEIYPIVATTGVVSPQGSFREGNNLDQILTWLNSHKQDTLVGTQTTGQNLKTLTINGTEVSLLGTGTISIQGGGGGGGDSDFFELDLSGNLHVKNDRGLYTGSFISAGGVGSGGGGGGSNTLEGLDDTSINNPHSDLYVYSLIYDSDIDKWVNGINYRRVNTIDFIWDPSVIDQSDPRSTRLSVHKVVDYSAANSLSLWEGNGITISDADAHTAGQVKFSVKLQSNGGLAFNSDGELYSTGGTGTLQPATASTLGGVKIGSGVNVASDGTISVSGGGTYTLPTASASTKGGIKIGTDLSMNGEVLSVDRSSLQTYLDGYYVHLTGAESVNGLKTFVDGIAIGNNTKTITLSSGTITINGDVEVKGNFHATGSVSAGA